MQGFALGAQVQDQERAVRNWSEVIWRAWRHSDDEELAGQLDNLVADEPASWPALAITIALGGLYGAATGLLAYLLFMETFGDLIRRGATVTWQGVGWASWAGFGLGSLAAVVVLFVLKRPWTWRGWLGRLAPRIALSPPAARRANQARRLLSNPQVAYFVGGLVGGLFLGFVGGVMGAFIADAIHRRVRPPTGPPDPRRHVSIWLLGIVGGIVGGMISIVFLMVAGLLGAFSARLTTWAVILLIVLLAGQVLAFVLGLDLGLAGALLWGLGGGLLGGVLIGLSAGPVTGAICGLSILLVNGAVGLFRASPHVWRWRGLWFWWRKRPPLPAVEAALEQACREHPSATAVWGRILADLARCKEEPGSADVLFQRLQGPTWSERFVARHALVALGGEAVELLRHATESPLSQHREAARWLLESIAAATVTRLAERASTLLCLRCLARCGPLPVELPDKVLFYYGCRNCGQSRDFLEWPGEVVAVLDDRMEVDHAQEGEKLYGNWLQRRTLFDFDRVEISRASDEEVERFAVQVSNDTDPWRCARYRNMVCWIARGSGATENSRRVLARLFGRVE